MKHPGQLRAAWLVACKEWRTGVRDKQTLIYAVLLPFALYPTLFWVMLQGVTFLQSRDAQTSVSVQIAGELPAEKDVLEKALTEAEGGPLEISGYVPAITAEEAREALAGDDTDLVLAFGAEGEAATLWHNSTESLSRLALERTGSRLEALALELRTQAIALAGTDWEALAPIVYTSHGLADERDMGGYILSLLLPLTFVVMAVMGAMIPAIDLTAGEKERGTAETTWLLPVDRGAVHLGKVLAVTGAALVATTLNLAGMALAAEHLLSSLPGKNITIEIPWASFFTVAPLTLIFLFTTSALLVAMASLTKSFKQGQSLLGMVQMLFIMPAVIAIMPGIELSYSTACVPILQTVLAFKGALQATDEAAAVPYLLFAIVVITQLGYAALAMWVSLRLTSQESLLEGGAKASDLLRLIRSPLAPR